MIVEDISPQAVAHDSGGVVASTGRHAFVYARDGRTLALPVEPLETYYLRLPARPTWSDGTPLTQGEADQLVADVRASFEHWNERCEFVAPGDPRILSTLDAVVDFIRAEASA
jgi:hypothetical protein